MNGIRIIKNAIYRIVNECSDFKKPAKIHGFSLYIFKYGSSGYDFKIKKSYEPMETKVISYLLKPGMQVVDVGANIGYYAILVSQQVGPKGQVYAFEPEPENFQMLTKNIELNKCTNVVPFQKAVAHKNEMRDFFISDKSHGRHSLTERQDGKKIITVECVTLDDVLKGKKIDLLKIDVETGEPWVLQGAVNTIQKSEDIGILFEFSEGRLKKAGFNPQEFIQSMAEKGFHFWIINEFTKSIQKTTLDTVFQQAHGFEEVTLFCSRNPNRMDASEF